MAEGGKKKKSKGTTVPLATFMKQTEGSWADISDDEAPDDHYNDRRYDDRRERSDDRRDRNDDSRRSYGEDRRGGYRNDSGRKNYDSSPKPIPDSPPYIAYVGNLAYDVTEEDVQEFFSEHCQVLNVRILFDPATNRSKGFGYVTFENRESLTFAIEAHNVSKWGRPLRVDVAVERDEPKMQRRSYQEDQPPSRADSVDRWERGQQLPTPERRPNQSGDRIRSSRDRDRDRDNNRERYTPDRERNTPDRERQNDNYSQPRPTTSSKPKSNPFGDAKPRDENAILQKKEAEWKEKGIKISSTPSDKPPVREKTNQPRTTKNSPNSNLYSVLAKEES